MGLNRPNPLATSHLLARGHSLTFQVPEESIKGPNPPVNPE